MSKWPNLRSLYTKDQTVWMVERDEDGLPSIQTYEVESVTTNYVKIKGVRSRTAPHLLETDQEEWRTFYSDSGIYAQAAPHLVFNNRADALERARNATLETLLGLKTRERDVVKHALSLTHQLVADTGGDARKGGLPEDVDQGIFNDLPESCEGCDGSGVRPATDNGQVYEGENKLRPGEQIVERCDLCAKFDSDLDAAASMFHSVREIRSVDGFHGVAASEEK